MSIFLIVYASLKVNPCVSSVGFIKSLSIALLTYLSIQERKLCGFPAEWLFQEQRMQQRLT